MHQHAVPQLVSLFKQSERLVEVAKVCVRLDDEMNRPSLPPRCTSRIQPILPIACRAAFGVGSLEGRDLRRVRSRYAQSFPM